MLFRNILFVIRHNKNISLYKCYEYIYSYKHAFRALIFYNLLSLEAHLKISNVQATY